MRYLALALAAACAVTAGPASAEALKLKPLGPHSRIAQRMCHPAGEECCCERVGLLCCEGLSCTRKIGNKIYCE